MARRDLLSNELISVWVETAEHVVTMERTAKDLPRDRDALRAFYREVVEALSRVDRPDFDLIADGRAAVGRNDETFEAVQAEFLQGLFGGFRTVVGVVRTTAGMLQVHRYDTTGSRGTTPVFTSPEAAHAYLAERRSTS